MSERFCDLWHGLELIRCFIEILCEQTIVVKVFIPYWAQNAGVEVKVVIYLVH